MSDLTTTIILEGRNQASAALQQAAGEQQALYDKITANMAVMSRMTAESAAAAVGITQHAAATNLSATAIQQHTGQVNTSVSALGQHATSTGLAQQAVGGFSAATEASVGVLGRLGSMLVSGVGFAAGIAGFNALSGAVSGAVKGAADLEQSVANISTVKPDIDTSLVFGKLNDISTRVPQTAQQLGAGLYNIFSSLEVSTQDGLSLVETFAKGAVGAATDAQTFGTAAMGVMNAYGLTTRDAGHISDVFFNTVKSGVVTGQELAQNLGLVTQAAKLAGVDLDSLGGFIAGVTKEGGSAQQNINDLNNLFLKINTKEAAAGFRELGIETVTSTGAMRPQIDVMTDLKAKTQDMTEAGRTLAIQKIFPDLQARAGAAVIIDQLDFVKSAIEENRTSAGAAEDAFTRMSGTVEAQTKLLGNAFTAIENELIVGLFPSITPVVHALAEALPGAMHSAGDALGTFATDLKTKASDGLQGMADRLAATGAAWAPWAAQAGEAGVVVDKSLAGTSEVIQALQFLVQGNFKAAWRDAQGAMGDFGGAAGAVSKIIEDNMALIKSVGVVVATWVVFSTVAPGILAAAEAYQALAAAMALVSAAGASGGVTGAVGALVGLAGGPVTLAIVGIAAAVAALGVAWVNNWGDIQGKTGAVTGFISDHMDQIKTAVLVATGPVGLMKLAWDADMGGIQEKTASTVTSVGTSLGNLRDAINTATDPINANIENKAIKWSAAITGAWTTATTNASINLATLGSTVKTGLDDVDTTMGKWQIDTHNKIVEAFSDTGIAAQIAKLAATIDTALAPITAKLAEWQVQAHNAIVGYVGDRANETGTLIHNAVAGGDNYSGSGKPYTIEGSAAAARPSQFSDPQLTADEALAACGPAALVAFMRASGGKVPTLREAINIAQTPAVGGWDTNYGMDRGVSGEQALLSAYGLSSNLNTQPTSAQIQAGANTGMGEIIDTGGGPGGTGHFFTATGYNPATDQYNVGTSGSDLVGAKSIPGSQDGTLLTLEQMTSLMGPVVGILSDIKGATTQTADAVKPGGAGSKEDLQTYARGAAERAGISPDIFQRQIQQESGFNKDVPQHGDPSNPIIGIAQFGAATAKSRGVDPNDPLASLDAAATYDAELLKKYGGSWEKVLSAYNAGEGHVASGAPNSAETKSYLDIILGGNSTGSFTNAAGAANTAMRAQAGDSAAAADDGAKRAAEIAAQSATAAADGIKSLTKLSQATTDWLDTSQKAEQKKLSDAETAAGKATGKVDTELAGKLGVDLTGQTSGAMFAQRNVDADIKARKDALADQIQDDTIANNIKIANDALVYKRGAEDQALASSRQREDAQVTTNIRLAQEALVHERGLQDAEIQYQHGLQLDATAHARKLEDAKIVADTILQNQATQHSRELQDQQTQVNAQLANAQLVHQRSLQDAQAGPDRDLQSTATAHGRSLQDQDAAYTLQKTQQRDAADYAQQLAAATSDTERTQLATTHQKALDNMALQAKYAAEDLAHRRQMEDDEAKYQEGLQAQALARSRQQQDAEIQYQTGVADRASDAQRARDDQEIAYQRGLQSTALADSRSLADAEQDYRDGLARTALEHSRGLQDAEVQYQIGIAHAALMAKRADEDAARKDARTLEDADIAHKVQLDAAARQFAKDEKAKQDVLDKALADEAYKRQVDALNAAAILQKKTIADNLIDQKNAIVEAAQTERDIKKKSFDESSAEIIAKAKDAVTKAGGDFAPIEAQMTATVQAMDLAFATAHGNSAAALTDLATQAAAALGKGGTITKAIEDTDQALGKAFGEGGTSPTAIKVSDKAVELFGQQFGVSWNVARPLLGQIEQGIYTNLGPNGLIPNHIQVSNDKVIAFAKQWGISWPEAAGILTTESDRIKATFGEGGSVPNSMHASQSAAGDLNLAIQGIQDKTVTVTTVYQSTGNGSITTSGGSGLNQPVGTTQYGAGYNPSTGTFDGTNAPQTSSGGSSGSGGDDSAASPFGGHIGESGPGGKYNNPSTGQPYTHAAGGVTTGPVGGIFGEAGPEAIIPLDQYFISHKSDVGGGGITDAQIDRLAAKIASELAAALPGVHLDVGASSIQSAIINLKRRGGSI